MRRPWMSERGARRSLGVPLTGLAVLVALTASLPSVAWAQSDPKAHNPVPADASVDALFVDFLHYARIGRFTLADQYARALLSHPDLDPTVVLEVANRDRESVDTLLILIRNSSLSDNAQKVLALIEKGEHLKRQDGEQIRKNIEQLGGNPQQEFFAQRHLAESGEYAIAPMIQTLLDPKAKKLWPRVIIALTKMGKPAVRPLVFALRMQNNDVRLHVIHALGEIGYPQAVPYLSQLRVDENLPKESKRDAAAAIARIGTIAGRTVPGSAAEQFYGLAERYYNEDDAVAADARLDTANVWYWDDATQVLKAVAVPRPIFGPVMAMRCCNEALRLRSDDAKAIALWLASNIRREARLGMDVEDGDPDAFGETDPTRPEIFPRALYFSQAAGPRYAHLVLQRALADKDTPVALGAIRALRITAGESSLIGTEDYQQPLVQALRFPDLIVRIRAALALGTALPESPFADSQYVVPLLARAITLTGRDEIVVVDADESSLNRVMGVFREEGRTLLGETSFYQAMARSRSALEPVSALLLSTDSADPDIRTAIGQFRSQFLYEKTPIVLLVKPGTEQTARDLAAADVWIETVRAAADGAAMTSALRRLRERTGLAAMDEDIALSLALEAVDALRKIAVHGRTVFEFGQAEPALVAALTASDEELQTKSASVLALLRTPAAQQAIAAMALQDQNAEALRESAFASLAESAKRYGSLLTDDQIAGLVRVAREEKDLTLRTAASRALGAVNLATNQASEIIRSYYGG